MRVTLVFCIAVASLISQSQSLLGFTRRKSWIYYEPSTDEDYQRNDDVTEHYITQKLDNFNPTDNRTFQMRYFKNQRYFKSGGPIFIFVGGEWVITPGAILPGQHITDLAKEFNGILYYTEHRYYGKTHPTNSTSVQNLRYLTVDQALADLAKFVEAKISDAKLNATGGVIMVGGSYSATMVTWFRQKYPHLVNGVWASSAPLRAKLDFYEYKEAVGVSFLKVGGEECYYKLEDIFQRLDDLAENDEIEYLRELFGLCDDFDGKDKFDLWNFHSTLSDILAGTVQNHRPGVIEYVCKQILRENPNATSDIESDEIFSFAEMMRRTLLPPGAKCISVNFNESVKEMLDDDWNGFPSRYQIRQWFYQTCSEFGWYQTSTSNKQPFGHNFPVELYLRFCNELYGESFTNATLSSYVHQKNVFYGALNPEVTNVFFTHGQIDPWHRMGILKDLNSKSPAAFIPGASHCNDLSAINIQRDSKEMLFAKLSIRNLVKSWLRL